MQQFCIVRKFTTILHHRRKKLREEVTFLISYCIRMCRYSRGKKLVHDGEVVGSQIGLVLLH